MAREIVLTRGLVALVDDADFDWLSQWRWYATADTARPYAARNGPRGLRPHTILMHRLIVAPPAGLVVDHISGATLDNRRQNLRAATSGQNRVNSAAQVGSCRYFGVHWDRQTKSYGAACAQGGRRIWHKRFKTAEAAARAYDAKALELWGDFARLNFPHEHRRAA